MNKVAYIAGLHCDVRAKKRLEKARTYLEAQGFEVSAMSDDAEDGIGRAEYLRRAVEKIAESDIVYFLEGWRDDDVAQMERSVCTFLCKPVRQFWE